MRPSTVWRSSAARAGQTPRQELRDSAELTRAELRAAGQEFVEAPTHLVPGGERGTRISRQLLDEFEIYAQPIAYPAVARGGERFRVTVAPFRTPDEISRFVGALATCLADD